MPEIRHCRYTNATEAIMQGLSVDVHATIDAGHDLPAGSTVVLRNGDVITMIDEDPDARYEHAWLEDLDDEQWAEAVAARTAEFGVERAATEADAEESDEATPKAKRPRRGRPQTDDTSGDAQPPADAAPSGEQPPAE
ncbi:MAG TPA: hypothetical protein VGL39_27930 [Jatrophihabitantaceae bacterium]|jgi:hypothetical protein